MDEGIDGGMRRVEKVNQTVGEADFVHSQGFKGSWSSLKEFDV